MSPGRAAGPDPLAALEHQPLRPCYLLHGDESFLVERALGVLRQRLLPAGRPGTWRTLWAGQAGESLAAALEDLTSPPLFGGPAIVVLRHAEALGEAEQALVLEILPTLGTGGCLVLVARVSDQRRRLFAACMRAGAAFAFPAVTDARAAAPWVVRLARELGHEIAPAAVEALLDRAGTDLGVLAGEVEKLALSTGSGRRIEVTHVQALVAAMRSHRVEELTDRLARQDLAGAAYALRQLLAEGEPPIRLVAFLAANLRRALHVAELHEVGFDADEIARRLGMPPWLVSRNLGRGRASDLVRALLVLRRLDVALKSTRPPDVVFDAALLAISGAGRPLPSASPRPRAR